MLRITTKREKRERRHKRVRAKVQGTSERPRLSVFRSSRHIYLQLIDDIAGKTIASASDLEIKPVKNKIEKTKMVKMSVAEKVGRLIAEKAAKKKITRAVFDRGGYAYHGIVGVMAGGARKGGLRL